MRSTHFNGIVATMGLVISFEALPTQSAVAGPEECQLHESARLGPFESFSLTGGAIACNDTSLFVGAPNATDDHPAGAVLVHVRQGQQWVLSQTLTPGDGAEGDRFGDAMALSGSTLFVASPMHAANGVQSGAVYVFVHDGAQWAQTAMLLPSDPANLQLFGTAVVADEDVLAVGTGDQPGSVYIFNFSGSSWNQQQKLVPEDLNGYLFALFGAALALDDDDLLIGAPASLAFIDRTQIERAGAAYAYRFDGVQWVFQQRLWSGLLVPRQAFGAAVGQLNDTAIVGAPGYGNNFFQPGSAHVFSLVNDVWQHDQQLVGSESQVLARFGSTVLISENRLIVGSPEERVIATEMPSGTTYPGCLYIFEPRAGNWLETGRLLPRHPNLVKQTALDMALGDDEVFVNARSWAYSSTFDYVGDWILRFDNPFPDCDRDGEVDQCELDCNANQIPDGCELASGDAPDCNHNAIPDECEATYTYKLDHDFGPAMYGFPQPLDFAWLNQFTVQHGGEVITHVCLPWSAWVPPFTPITIVIYDDPSGDGNPSDAIAIASTQAAILNDAVDGTSFPVARVRIPPTPVGSPGESFFVGAFVRNPGGCYFAAGDITQPNLGRSWYFTGPPGTLDPLDLQTATSKAKHTRNWMLRAISLDCNANGIWDQCDIDDGFSLDLNANGVPDECDAPCPADINGSGGVNISDLLAVISAWGTPGSGGEDVNGDNIVDIADLLAVIAAWGACP